MTKPLETPKTLNEFINRLATESVNSGSGKPIKRFERKCGWCGRSFNHWRSHWNHEKKCREAPTEAEVFKGFQPEDSQRESKAHSEIDAQAEGRTEGLRKRLLPTRGGDE